MAYKKIAGNATTYPGITGFFDSLPTADEDCVSEISPIKIRRIHIEAADCGSGSETSLGVAMGATDYVLGAALRVTTAETTGSTKTIEIGTDSADSGDADGFIDGASVAATGAVAHTCALKGVMTTSAPNITVTVPNAFTEFVGDLYIFYIEV